ncbi:MAG: hypothetical protein RSF83_10735 [Hungatella sp.]
MTEEQDLKLTDLDYLIGNHHLQMMKAALPYMKVPEQKMLSVFVKFNELQRTITLFHDEEVAAMGIASLADQKTPSDMLRAIKPYGNVTEQNMIDLFCKVMQGNSLKKAPLEQLKSFLSPDQQAGLETMQLIMQAMQA